MRFNEYCASFITPQMTLLEKFNALLKFMKEEKQFNIFFSSQKWQDNVSEYNISDLNLGDYELKLYDVIVFTNGYYSYINTLGEETFTLGEIYYFVGEKGETGTGISSMGFNSQRHLIVNYTNGNVVDLGLIKGVSSFLINESQHLIVNFDNGTTQDLGSIFSGNVNINGNFTADSIIENMSGFSFQPISSQTGIEKVFSYASCVKNGNKLTFAVAGKFTITTLSRMKDICQFTVPVSIGNKLFPITGTAVLGYQKLALFVNDETVYDGLITMFKDGNNRIRYAIFSADTTKLPLDTEYQFRLETTFLLSDNMVGD